MFCGYFEPDDRGGICHVYEIDGYDGSCDLTVCKGCPALYDDDGNFIADRLRRRLEFWSPGMPKLFD